MSLKLNEEQLRAVTSPPGPALVLAGPGSGKTTVIVARLIFLLKSGASPEQILVLTYTKAAAKQMQERFKRAIADEMNRGTMLSNRSFNVSFGTIHACLYHILCKYSKISFKILPVKQKYAFLKYQLKRYAKGYSTSEETVKCLAEDITNWRVKLMMEESRGGVVHNDNSETELKRQTGKPFETQTGLPFESFKLIAEAYLEYSKSSDYLDFDDIIIRTYELFLNRSEVLTQVRNDFRYFLVDEYQDISPLQEKVLEMMVGNPACVFAVGDDDQSIYGFRGSDPACMKRFSAMFKGTRIYKLGANYRCGEQIVECAAKVIEENKNRFKKELKSVACVEGKVRILEFQNQQEQAEFIASEIAKKLHGEMQDRKLQPEDFCVLFRAHILAGPVAEALSKYKVPSKSDGTIPTIYEAFCVRLVLSYMEAAEQMNNTGRCETKLLLRIMNCPERGITRDFVNRDAVDLKQWVCEMEHLPEMKVEAENLIRELRIIYSLPPALAMDFVLDAAGVRAWLVRENLRAVKEKDADFELLSEVRLQASSFMSFRAFKVFIKEQVLALKDANAGKANDSGNGQGNSAGSGCVQLQTLHACKGLEYNYVYIIDVEEGVIPYSHATTPEAIEEERRLLYVGMTRARYGLTISSVKMRLGKEQEVCRFLKVLK